MNVSLCLIVRDEEDCLARCLESVSGLAGEIVVVDTGSTDHTVEIALEYGARMFSYRWDNNFAAARNYALLQASGDWILVLDADEVLAAVGADRWSELLAAPEVEGYLLEVRNYLDEGYATDHIVRLFRNRPGYRFAGAIHEQVAGAIRTANGTLRCSGLVIHHYGYLGPRLTAKDKHRRNSEIIGRALTDRPGDPFLLYSLAVEHLQAGDPERGATCLAGALARMNGGEGYFHDALVALGLAFFTAGRTGALKSHLENCLTMLPLDSDLHLLQGLLALEEGRYAQAVEDLRPARDARCVGRGLAMRLLGDACHLAGLFAGAGQAYLAALQEAPGDLYPLTQILGMRRRGHPGPGWEELSRFTSPAVQKSLAGQLARSGEPVLALVCALLAVLQGDLPGPDLPVLPDGGEPVRSPMALAYLRVCAAQMQVLAEGARRGLPAPLLPKLAAGCLELAAGQLCPSYPPPVYRRSKLEAPGQAPDFSRG